MTVIAAIIDGTDVWMGSDQQAGGNFKSIQPGIKVFRNGDFLIGFSGHARIADLLRYSFEPPKRHSDIAVDKYMRTDFVNAMRSCLQQGGELENDKGLETAFHDILVGYEGRIFNIACDFACLSGNRPFMATGSGLHFALGSLWSTTSDASRDWTPKQHLEAAINAAIAMDHGCGGEPEVMCLPGKKEAA